MLARVRGDTALSALSTEGTSIPVIVIAGPDHTLEPRPPLPTSGSPGRTSASSRNSSSLYEAPVHSSRRSPSTATSPFSSCSDASAVQEHDERVRARRRRTGPSASLPTSVSTSTVGIAVPRSATVSVGRPGRTLPMSAISIASDGGTARGASADTR